VLLPDELGSEEEERELIEAAFDMCLLGGDKDGCWGGRGLMRMPGLVPERGREWQGGRERTAAIEDDNEDEDEEEGKEPSGV